MSAEPPADIERHPDGHLAERAISRGAVRHFCSERGPRSYRFRGAGSAMIAVRRIAFDRTMPRAHFPSTEEMRMKTWTTIPWIALAMATSQAGLAQTPNSASMGQPAAMGQPATGAAFVQQALQNGMTQLELSKVAMNDSTNPVVIRFARGTLRDLTQSNAELRNIAEKNGMNVPTTLDAQHEAMVKRLRVERGSQFDREFAQEMGMLDDESISLYQGEAGDTHAELSAYARRMLPSIQAQRNVAQDLKSLPPGVG